ncbi:hypothetical protein DSO57_1029632 [Entomophthora muscae]|uniref:Uncharacterized protein n=1 Tax=Entomophthora muscae TaxID=34485 RepID=A0ACC2UAU6_9FUNG|nr:hypothetical protein DSO57_1029632 [Entomophthora muscae]
MLIGEVLNELVELQERYKALEGEHYHLKKGASTQPAPGIGLGHPRAITQEQELCNQVSGVPLDGIKVLTH